MKAMGVRAAKDHFRWAIVERADDEYAVLDKGKCAAPKSYDEPDALAWYRERVQTLIRQFKPDAAAVRYAETFFGGRKGPSAKTLPSMYSRARIEGVVIEAIRAAGLQAGIGGWQSISSRMGTKSAKAYTATGELRGLDITKLTTELQEAVVTAASMLGR